MTHSVRYSSTYFVLRNVHTGSSKKVADYQSSMICAPLFLVTETQRDESGNDRRHFVFESSVSPPRGGNARWMVVSVGCFVC
mmetsp:Transcript_12880/g.36315  ORF Transcript_12880/g.36315 Transcript_12880/m.36315 type:complete len:82 (-) Transcript_12880:3492-3737(-)